AHELVTTGSPETPGLPCTMVLTVSFVLSPVTGLFCHRRPQDHCLTGLISASGYQDHTTWPSALASPVLRRCRVHRIPHPTFVTIAIRPSIRGGTGKLVEMICP